MTTTVRSRQPDGQAGAASPNPVRSALAGLVVSGRPLGPELNSGNEWTALVIRDPGARRWGRPDDRVAGAHGRQVGRVRPRSRSELGQPHVRSIPTFGAETGPDTNRAVGSIERSLAVARLPQSM